MKRTAGDIFVRYLVSGGLVLLLLIMGVKTLTVTNDLTAMTLAAVIFLVNIVVVLGYTFAIINNKDFLLDEDAPDLAYYLGFSLTVASLAISFISDVGLASDADAKSNLVKGSLAQFGSGLLATLIGLCSKIYISSKQSHLASDPQVLYQAFRQEIRGFEDSMNSMTSSLDTTIKAACRSIEQSAELAADSMKQMAERLKTGADSISEHLTVEKIAHPIAAFSDELQKLQSPAKEFTAEMTNLVGSASLITKSFSTLDTAISDVQESAVQEVKNIDILIETKKRLNDTNIISINLFEEQNITVTEANKQLTRLKNASSKTAESYELVGAASANLLKQSSELEEGLLNVNNSLQETTTKLSELIALTKDFGVSLQSSTGNIDGFSARTTFTSSVLAGTSNIISEVNAKLNNVPESITRTLSSLNSLTNSLANTATATEPLVRSLSEVNPPLNQTSESAKSLNSAIAKLNQDVLNLSMIVSKSAR